MCTAITFKKNHLYFGRTLDYDLAFDEKVVVAPRNFIFDFRHEGRISSHYAIIGTAIVEEGFPLFFDGMNEKGLCVAGLNFVGNAVYSDVPRGRFNIAQFEFIPWILGLFSSVDEVRRHIREMTLVSEAFSAQMPPAELHWLIADAKDCITVEFVESGVKVYDNPIGVLTNNPPFDMQLFNLNNYMSLSTDSAKNSFAKGLKLYEYGRGMGAMGLPGDLSPASRFVRAAFVKLNSACDRDQTACVNQFFHILGSVDNQRGCCRTADGRWEITRYTCCMDADDGIYYYSTYENHRLSAVDMQLCNLEAAELKCYDMHKIEDILMQNS